MSLTEQEIIRYSRHIILPEVGGRGQLRLKEAAVLVAGLGAVGSAAAIYLAAAGIGRFFLWDPGVVLPHDLTGAMLHDPSRLGLSRAESVAHILCRINPGIEAVVLDPGSDPAVRMKDCAVALASKGDWLALWAAAKSAGRALVLTGIAGAVGAVAVFRDKEPCLNCLGPERAAGHSLLPEAEGADVVAAAAGVVGTAAATEGIKLILSIGQPLTGRILTYNGWRGRVEDHPFQRLDSCAACSVSSA